METDQSHEPLSLKALSAIGTLISSFARSTWTPQEDSEECRGTIGQGSEPEKNVIAIKVVIQTEKGDAATETVIQRRMSLQLQSRQ